MITSHNMIPGSDRALDGKAGGVWVSCQTDDSKTQQHNHTGPALKREAYRGSAEAFKDQRGREGRGFLPPFPVLSYLRFPSSLLFLVCGRARGALGLTGRCQDYFLPTVFLPSSFMCRHKYLTTIPL